MKISDFLKLFARTFKEWVHDRADGLAASIAYYQLMAIGPFVALLVLASSAIFGAQESKEEVEPIIAQFFHPQFIVAIKYMLEYSFDLDESKKVTITVLAIVSLIHGTLAYFEQVRDTIETFWDKRTEEATFKARMMKKVEALLMASVTFTLLIIGFIMCHWFGEMNEGVFRVTIRYAIEFVVLFFIILFLLIYCPPKKIDIKLAVPGVLMTTILYVIGRIVLRYILSHQKGAPEDVAATLILYLLWAYYSAMVFLFGAEFTKLYLDAKKTISKNQDFS